ncbi:MAG TPA: helix-turn-helix domain-containing protein [Thermoanaerobaculia bacterium]|nr:helix-turn-helix domain-containing protein [Thermoanaerobaculia bacterium]
MSDSTHLDEWRADETELIDAYLELPPPVRERRFLDTARAAELVGVSRRTIQLWIDCGAIRALRVGRRHMVLLSTLRSYLHSCALEAR